MAGELDTGLPDRIKEWIDARVSSGLKAVYNGARQLLSSGFGKGLLVVAALFTATVMIGAFVAPESILGEAGLNAGQTLTKGLMRAGNLLLGSWPGLVALGAGGAIGSMTAAHAENNRINKEAAENNAIAFTRAREANIQQPVVAPQQEMQPASEQQPEVSGGHCARLMQEQLYAQRDNMR